MSFYKKYELLDVLRDDGVKTFQARESESGRSVEVHLMVGVPGKSEPPYELLDQIRSFPQGSRPHLLEIGEHMGTAYVVTLPLAGYASLRDWIKSSEPVAKPAPAYDPLSRVGRWQVPGSDAGAPPTPQPVTQKPRVDQPDTPDITRMFQTANLTAARKEDPPPAPPSGDEFSRLFASGPVKPTPPPVTPSPDPGALSWAQASEPASGPANPSESGDITRMFQVSAEHRVSQPPVPPAVQPPIPQSSGSSAPGEFTSMFQVATGQHKAPEPPLRATGQMPVAEPPKSPQPPAAAAPGEFTSMFKVPDERKVADASPPAPAPAPPATAPGEFTSMFKVAPEPKPSLQRTGQMPVAEPLKSPQAPSAPTGEFTDLYQVPTGDHKLPEPPLPLVSTGQRPVPKPSSSQQMRAATPEPSVSTGKSAAPPAPNVSTGQIPVPKPSKSQQMPVPAMPPTPAAPGEFTSLFKAPLGPEPADPVEPAQGAPGEFTRMFRAAPMQPLGEATAPPTPSVPATPAAQKAPPPAAPQQASEFTRMFAAPSVQPLGEPPVAGGTPQPSPPQPPSSSPGQAPGEFTRIFSTPAGGAFAKPPLPIATPQQSPLSQPNPFAAPTAPLPQSMVPQNPGASSPFSQQKTPFATPAPLGQQGPAQPGIGAIPQRPYAAPAQPTVDDEYAKLFGGGTPKQGGSPAQPGFPAAPQAPPQQAGGFGSATQSFHAPQMPVQPGQSQGISEYTRMFNAPIQPQPPVPVPVPIAAVKRSAKWPIFVIAGIVLVVIIGLVIALMRK